jgi:hypothetical protein
MSSTITAGRKATADYESGKSDAEGDRQRFADQLVRLSLCESEEADDRYSLVPFWDTMWKK